MKGFLYIDKLIVPKEFIDDMYAAFQETGKEGYERVALWAGEVFEKEFQVTHLIFPKQTLHKTPHGLSYSVDGEELDRINRWLYNNKKTIIAQLHSHPTEAYHSEVDDDFAIVATVGGFSIVVPDFGNTDQYLNNSAFFRMSPHGSWVELNRHEVKELLKILE